MSSARRIRTPTSCSIDAAEALAKDGVWAVITGEDIRKISDPFLVALKSPVHQWSLAVDRVRYVGEPVALVVAESRYLAEDAAELVEIEYAPLEAVIDPLEACEQVVAAAARRSQDQRDFGPQIPLRRHQDAHSRRPTSVVKLTVDFPPAVVHADGMLRRRRARTIRPTTATTCMANFQGPFSTHPVMARALRVPGPKMRLRIPPDSGGSFGIKLSVFPYVVLTALAAKITGRPVKWVEDRAEHLLAASSGPEPRHRDRSGGDEGRQILGAEDGSARGLRRVPARADAGAALPHARRA